VPPPANRPLRAAWKVALYAFAITVAIGTAVGLVAVAASGAIDQDPWHSGALYGRALSPFVLAVTLAAYFIQRARIARP
jgi:ABC-type dipeptide/oligopeptide/nickel transport system permease component